MLFLLVIVFLVSGCDPQTAQDVPEPTEVLDIPEEIDEVVEEIVDIPTVDDTPPPVEPSLVNGKTVDVRIKEAYDMLHAVGSAQHIRDNFPDIEVVFTDTGDSNSYPEIYPFRYQYSEEADITFNLCNIERTVFICKGKLDRLISNEDLDSGKCIITPIYQDIFPS